MIIVPLSSNEILSETAFMRVELLLPPPTQV